MYMYLAANRLFVFQNFFKRGAFYVAQAQICTDRVRQQYFVTYKEDKKTMTLVKENNQFFLVHKKKVVLITNSQANFVLSKIVSRQVNLVGCGIVGCIESISSF